MSDHKIDHDYKEIIEFRYVAGWVASYRGHSSV